MCIHSKAALDSVVQFYSSKTAPQVGVWLEKPNGRFVGGHYVNPLKTADAAWLIKQLPQWHKGEGGHLKLEELNIARVKAKLKPLNEEGEEYEPACSAAV